MTEAPASGAPVAPPGEAMRRPLDHSAIAREVRARRLPVGAPLHYVASVGSTNDLARDLAGAGAGHGTVVVADEQVAGRGRRGATRWQTPARASIAMSVVVRVPAGADPERLGRLGLCVAVAAAEAIEAASGARTLVKWPNDVVAVGGGPGADATRKVGGILVEPSIVAATPPRVAFAVVGVGVNVNLPGASMAPVDATALPPASVLDLVGHETSRERLAVALLAALGKATVAWDGSSWPSWRARYEARMAWRGDVVEVTSEGAATWQGRLEGIDESGALVAVGAGGKRGTVVSGHVRRP